MRRLFKDLFSKNKQVNELLAKNRIRFESIIADKRSDYLENIFKRLFTNDDTLTDAEVLNAYFKFSDKIQTNTVAAAELEWVIISVLCHFRPNLIETLVRRGLFNNLFFG